ncbi:MAG: ATP-binding protein [Acidobacteriota bacterium]
MEPSRRRRRILWFSVAVAATGIALFVSVVFLNPSSVGNRRFLWNLQLWAGVWSIVFLLLLSLTVVLARHIIHAFFEIEGSRRGAGIKSKLVRTFTIFSLFPALIMAFLAFGLINQNLSSWVSAPAEQLLSSAHEIAEIYYQELERRLGRLADALAAQATESDPAAWERLLADSGLTGGVLLDESGQVKRTVGIPPTPPPPTRLHGQNRPFVEWQVNRGTGISDRLWLPLPAGDGSGGSGGTWWFYEELPESAAFALARVEEAYAVLPGLKGSLASLRVTYLLILFLTTLTVVFGFVWLGDYIARRLTGPLEALARGAGQLAAGNLQFRIQAPQDAESTDELRVVIDSFNRMADELEENRRRLEAANEELRRTNLHLEERRRYIEAVLQNIATGVLTFDDSGVIRTVNYAAAVMLHRDPEQMLGKSWKTQFPAEVVGELEAMQRRALLYGTYRSPLTIQRPQGPIHVAATMTVTSGNGQREFLLVLDDLTEMIRAERFAAWQEVARRLAHEIKNPLTPIQLSVQRIQRRFRRLAAAFPEHPEVAEYEGVLQSAAAMIEAETQLLRNLLAEFSRFARLPIAQPRPFRLDQLIETTLQRYESSLSNIRVECALDPRIDRIEADPDQLQRVLANLIDNALDALADQEDRRLTIRTQLNPDRDTVKIEVADNGKGIQQADFEQLFLPYFSTKRKGTGLGLAIVRQIVNEHHGNVRAEANLPRGTRFIVELPLSWKGDYESQAVGRG